MHEIHWRDLAACIAGPVLVGLLIMHGVAGYYYVRYYVRHRHEPELWKCQPSRFMSAKLHRTAVWSCTGNMVLGGLLTGCLIYAYSRGLIHPPIYFKVAEHGVVYTLLSTAVLFVLNDAAAYYVHRLLHVKWLFRNVHRFHHKFVAPSPYVAIALHPVELIALQTASFLPLFFIPFHVYSIGLVLVYILVFNIIDHSGVRLESSVPFQPPSRFHDDHHAFFHVNFGQHLMIWDRLHGTLRREGRIYGKEVFGGRGAPPEREPEGAKQPPEPFVSY